MNKIIYITIGTIVIILLCFTQCHVDTYNSYNNMKTGNRVEITN